MESKSKKAWRIKDRISDKAFIETCLKADSMAAAAAHLGLHFNSLKKRAIELGCYQPNQAGIGIRKNKPKVKLLKPVHQKRNNTLPCLPTAIQICTWLKLSRLELFKGRENTSSIGSAYYIVPPIN